MIRSIAHLTDLSPEGTPAFEHALRLALAYRCELHVIHVGDPDHDGMPRVRGLLQRWGYIEPGARAKDILPATGVTVIKAKLKEADVVDALWVYLTSNRLELIVAASHGRAGLLHQSVSAKIAQVAKVPALIFGPAARPFVDSKTGNFHDINTMLVPVDHDPAPDGAIMLLDAFAEQLGIGYDFVHIGASAPALPSVQGAPRTARTLKGAVVETILDEASKVKLMAMPMAGRNGLIDALRGSTTERVLNEVTCPVLVIPVAS